MEITYDIQVTWNMYDINNANNMGNMGHLTKEQFTWQFWNMAGITMYLQLPFNLSSHLFYMHDPHKSQTYINSCIRTGTRRGIGFYTWYLLLIIWAGRKYLLRKLCSKEQHPPWSYPVVIVRSKGANLFRICVNKNM